MKNTSNISGTGNQSGQVYMNTHAKNPVSTVRLLVLGVVFIVLVALTAALYQQFIVTKEYGLLVYFLGMLAIAVFTWLSALLASRFHTEKAKPAQHKVRAALISALNDEDPDVRAEAVEGLSVLELEKYSYQHTHDRLEGTLIKYGIP